MTWDIQTTASDAEIRAFLDAHKPWRMALSFNDGAISSDEYGTREPYNRAPLAKLNLLQQHIPDDAFRGAVLDVGFNIGYNSIHLAQNGATVTGIEVSPYNHKIATALAGMAEVSVDLNLGDAETFVRPEAFDLVLHLGTLYHLPNPHLALKAAAENLHPGGYLALETVAYLAGEDPFENLWSRGFNGDNTNTWALGKATIEDMLASVGFDDVRLIREVELAIYEGKMSRVVYVAKLGSRTGPT